VHGGRPALRRPRSASHRTALTGFDVQTINLRNIFNGVLPVTADLGADPADLVSNQGELSQDIN